MDTSADYSGALGSLAGSIPHMVWMARPDGSIEYFNQRTLVYAGLAAEEVWGWAWLKLIYADDASLAEQTRKGAIQGGGPYAAEYRIRDKDGKYYWHQTRALSVRDSNGRITKWVGTWTDIDEDKRTEQGVRELAAIVESSDDAIVGKTLEGIVTSWNRGGGYFGARLAQAGCDVGFIARGAHLAALCERGLVVESKLGNLSLSMRVKESRRFPGGLRS